MSLSKILFWLIIIIPMFLFAILIVPIGFVFRIGNIGFEAGWEFGETLLDTIHTHRVNLRKQRINKLKKEKP